MEQRIHRLIKQGGLIDLAGLNTIDKPLMAGLLVDCKKRLDFMTEEEKYSLRNLGYLTMKARKGQRQLQKARAKIKPFKFWQGTEVQPWQELM